MNELEQRIRRLPRTRPSTQLRDRIFAERRPARHVTPFLPRSIPTAWAAVLVLIGTLAGYLTARSGQTPAMGFTKIYILEQVSDQNPFEFTDYSMDPLPGNGELVVNTLDSGEVL